MMIVLAALCIQGCSKDVMDVAQAQFGGPTSATLVILGASSDDSGSSDASSSGTSDTKSAGTKSTVDETNLVHSLRIYAFKHSPNDETENNEMVGYFYTEDLSGSGPYYCTMDLSASGYIDFYVIANDGYANIVSIGETASTESDTESDSNATEETTTLSLTSTSTRTEIEAVRFDGMTGKTADGQTATIAVPMSNIEDTSVTDISLDETSTAADLGNNFTFYVPESGQSAVSKVITITITRAMSRLSLWFSKISSMTSTVKITSATLNGINSTVLLCPPGTSPVYETTGESVTADDIAYTDAFFTSTDGVEVTKTTTSLWLTSDSAYEQLTYDDTMTGTTNGDAVQTYILPNPYGSTSTGSYARDENSPDDGYGGSRLYTLDLAYTITASDATTPTSNTAKIYLPIVSTNSHVKIKCTFDEVGISTSTVVTVVSWTSRTMDMIYFD